VSCDYAARVYEILEERTACPREVITPGALIVDDLGADSLDRVEIVLDLEASFGFEIPDEEANKLSTVQDLFDYLDSRLRQEIKEHGL